uniref:Uncharacterized protein n=1 Tax=Heterorhabditis bacteriophora TaxID=37862 RepID=A0A1I7WHI4_HETBA
MNSLRLQEEFSTNKSIKRPGKLDDHKKGQFCGQRRVARPASMKSVGLVALMLKKLRCGEFSTSVQFLRVFKNKAINSLFRI